MPPLYTVNGRPTAEAWCGQGPGAIGTTIGFDVPGYDRAWIVVAQDGRITFDGPMDLPMPLYTLRCPEDLGLFYTVAYDITAQGTRGNRIGQTQINVKVVPGPSPSGGPSGVPNPVPAPNGTPPPIGQPLYVPPQIIETGSRPGPTFYEEPEPEQAGFFANVDLTTVALLALGALVVLPPLFSRRRGY